MTVSSIRMLASLMNQWKNVVMQPMIDGSAHPDKYLELSMHCSKTAQDSQQEKHCTHTLHNVEGFATAMLCRYGIVLLMPSFTGWSKKKTKIQKENVNRGKVVQYISGKESSYTRFFLYKQHFYKQHRAEICLF